MVVPRNGVLLWGAGDLYDSSVLADRSNVPFLSLSDGVGDLGLLALVVVAVTVSGWRVPGVWRRMAPAFAIFVLADSVYLVQVAEGTYALGGLVDLGWPVAALMIGLAAQQPRTSNRTASTTGQASSCRRRPASRPSRCWSWTTSSGRTPSRWASRQPRSS